jgi:hypothetical protein
MDSPNNSFAIKAIEIFPSATGNTSKERLRPSLEYIFIRVNANAARKLKRTSKKLEITAKSIVVKTVLLKRSVLWRKLVKLTL